MSQWYSAGGLGFDMNYFSLDRVAKKAVDQTRGIAQGHLVIPNSSASWSRL